MRIFGRNQKETETAESSKETLQENNNTNNKKGLFQRLKKGLSRTRSNLTASIDTIFKGKKRIDDDTLEELEEILILADMGMTATGQLISHIEKAMGKENLDSPDAIKEYLRTRLLEMIKAEPLSIDPSISPYVIMVIGVNGVGKTTTIGKLAHKLKKEGHKVLLVAGDTFRAAAPEQLQIWAERVGVDIVKQKMGADPSAVVYDALNSALSRGHSIVLVDTAGRLHTKVNLMEELKKIKRVMGKLVSNAPHETMLVLDATTGQNAISQARLFNEAVKIDGITLTKMDSSSKGGIVVAISQELNIPIRFIGIGEKIDDLRPFEAEDFVRAIL